MKIHLEREKVTFNEVLLPMNAMVLMALSTIQHFLQQYLEVYRSFGMLNPRQNCDQDKEEQKHCILSPEMSDNLHLAFMNSVFIPTMQLYYIVMWNVT